MYRVLIVDDEPFIVEGLYDLIDWPALGLEIVGQAGNGKQALEVLAKLPVDILMTDISMPVMNGLELIREVRQQRDDLKVVILSGYNEFDYLKQAMTMGIENYLLKPVDVKELVATLQNTVDKLNNESAPPAQIDNNVLILRDTILNRWLTNRISIRELSERASMLRLDIDAPYYVAAVAGADPDAKRRIEAWLREPEVQAAGCVAFENHDGDAVLLFPLRRQDAGKLQAIRLLRGLVASSEAGRKLRISLGQAVDTAENAHISYEQAMKAQAYFLVYAEEDILDYDQLASGRERDNPAVPIDWDRYVKLISTLDGTGLLEQIDADFARIRSYKGATPELVRSIAIEIIIRLKAELNETKRKETAVRYDEAIAGIPNAKSAEELLSIVKRAATATIDMLRRESKSPVIHQVLQTIRESYAEPITLKGLGSKYHIHPAYLGQLFQKETNESFTEYVNKFRIEKAKELLRDSTRKVQDIAREVGYWELGYFYKQFKKYVGASPTDYREML